VTENNEPVSAAEAGTPPHGDDLSAAAIAGDTREPSPGQQAGTRHGRQAVAGDAPVGAGGVPSGEEAPTASTSTTTEDIEDD
jgi:hypothetical protein